MGDNHHMGVGLDMNLLGKLSVVMDYYNKTTNGILMTINTPITFALSNYYDNVGKIRNSGFEFSATWNDKIGQVGYSVGGNIAFNKNKILE
jgi:outer membrane receptor protein involved in Fe transport